MKKWVEQNQGLLIKSGLVIGGGVFLVYLLRALGVIQSSAEKKAEAEKEKLAQQNATSLDSAFNPSYYKSKPGATLITKATAISLAEKIEDALGDFWGDDESAIYAVFRQLKAKTQVSFLADIFFQQYQEDLYGMLASNLNANEMDTINQIVKGMAAK